MPPSTSTPEGCPSTCLDRTDATVRLAFLWVMYRQEIHLLSSFCGRMSVHSFRLIHLDPEIVMAEGVESRMLVDTFIALLETAEELPQRQQARFMTEASERLDMAMREIDDLHRTTLNLLSKQDIFTEYATRERLVRQYTRTLMLCKDYLLGRGLQGASPDDSPPDSDFPRPYPLCTAFLQALRIICSHNSESFTRVPQTSRSVSLSRPARHSTGYEGLDQLRWTSIIDGDAGASVEEVFVANRRPRSSSSMARVYDKTALESTARSDDIVPGTPEDVTTSKLDVEVSDLLKQLIDNNEYYRAEIDTLTDGLGGSQAGLTQDLAGSGVSGDLRDQNCKRILEMAEEIRLLTETLDARDAMVASMRTELSSLHSEYSALTIEHTSLLESLETQKGVVREATLLSEARELELAEVSRELSGKVTALSSAIQEMARLREELAQRTDRTYAADAKITSLESELEVRDTQLRRSAEQVRVLHDELKEKTAQITTLEIRSTGLQLQTGTLQTDLEHSQLRVRELETVIEQKDTQYNQKLEEAELLRTENREQAERVMQVSTLLTGLRMEVEKVRLERDSGHREVQRLTHELQGKDKEVENVLGELQKATQQIIDLEGRCSEQQIHLDQTEITISTLKGTISQLQAELMSRNNELRSKEQLLRTLQDKDLEKEPDTSPDELALSSSPFLDFSQVFSDRVRTVRRSWIELCEVLHISDDEREAFTRQINVSDALIKALYDRLKEVSGRVATSPSNIRPSKDSEEKLTVMRAKVQNLKEALRVLKDAYKDSLERLDALSTQYNETVLREVEYKTNVARLQVMLRRYGASEEEIPGDLLTPVPSLQESDELLQLRSQLASAMSQLHDLQSNEHRSFRKALESTIDQSVVEDSPIVVCHVSTEGTQTEPYTQHQVTQTRALTSSNLSEEKTVQYDSIEIQTIEVPGEELILDKGESERIQEEISDLHRTIAMLTCELVQLRNVQGS
ncbi:Coiled-coil protein [Giardia muris]|uniref:Coiled-coil protein n=1 Tax=Giardia muris TaxID=5742 RepID=A0A4Z1SNW4_GIAMU|nr:Coiled-coil protein [Giardia muris]|eukprot:TNJ27486.1 Coiled-coil protein [Giardia muris]